MPPTKMFVNENAKEKKNKKKRQQTDKNNM
jgi:hypothetical protein